MRCLITFQCLFLILFVACSSQKRQIVIEPKDVEEITYYENKVVKEIYQLDSLGEYINNRFLFSKEGALKAFHHYDNKNNLRFIRTYNDSGIVDEGKPIHVGFNSSTKNDLRKGDIIDFYVFYASIPFHKLSIQVFVGKVKVADIVDVPENTTYTLPLQFDYAGEYKLKFVLLSKDTVERNIERVDTAYVPIKVENW